MEKTTFRIQFKVMAGDYFRNLSPGNRARCEPLTYHTWAHSTWAADAVGPVLGWGELGSQSAGRPEKPWFSWSGLHWPGPTTGAVDWDRSTPENKGLGPIQESGLTWLYCYTILWQSLEELQHTHTPTCCCKHTIWKSSSAVTWSLTLLSAFLVKKWECSLPTLPTQLPEENVSRNVR